MEKTENTTITAGNLSITVCPGYAGSEKSNQNLEQALTGGTYDCDDLMQFIQVFDEDTAPEDLKALTEAYTVEDVKARIMEH